MLLSEDHRAVQDAVRGNVLVPDGSLIVVNGGDTPDRLYYLNPVSGAVLGIVGVILVVPRFQELFAQVVAPVTRGATALSAGLGGTLFGQFSLGLLLGAIWTPCTGPTLAAAVTLAARGESRPRHLKERDRCSTSRVKTSSTKWRPAACRPCTN